MSKLSRLMRDVRDHDIVTNLLDGTPQPSPAEPPVPQVRKVALSSPAFAVASDGFTFTRHNRRSRQGDSTIMRSRKFGRRR